jgi:hypothetical protein
MFNEQDPIPLGELCKRYDDGAVDCYGLPALRTRVFGHIYSGNLPHIKKWNHYYVLETDFVEWLKKYRAGEFKQGVRKKRNQLVETAADKQLSNAKTA